MPSVRVICVGLLLSGLAGVTPACADDNSRQSGNRAEQASHALAPTLCEMRPGPRGIVARVLDGETFILEDGTHVRLLNVFAPRAPMQKQPPSDALAQSLAQSLTQSLTQSLASLASSPAPKKRRAAPAAARIDVASTRSAHPSLRSQRATHSGYAVAPPWLASRDRPLGDARELSSSREPRHSSPDHLETHARNTLARMIEGREIQLWSAIPGGRKARKRRRKTSVSQTTGAKRPARKPRSTKTEAWPSDRYGRLLAHVTRITANNSAETDQSSRKPRAHRWVQAELARAGAARIFSTRATRSCVASLLSQEAEARAHRRGLWAHPRYRVYAASDVEGLAARRHRFELVEGRVRYVARFKRFTYVNFGSDWRTDFTVRIARRVAARLHRDGVNLATLEGARLRVRGFIERRDGPMIELTHAEAVEVLSPPDLHLSSALDELAAIDQLRDNGLRPRAGASRPADASEHTGAPAATDRRRRVRQRIGVKRARKNRRSASSTSGRKPAPATRRMTAHPALRQPPRGGPEAATPIGGKLSNERTLPPSRSERQTKKPDAPLTLSM